MQPYESEEEADEQLQDMNQDTVGNSGIYDELYASLNSLQSDLCSKLYSREDAILSADLVEELSIASVKSFRGDLSSQGLQDVSYSSDQAPEVAHLRAAQERLTMWLLHLSKAADLARKVEEAPQNRNDPEKMEIQFLEDYHCLLDPVGTAENKERNRIDEEEWDDLEVQWLGNLFVFARPRFLLSIQNAPEEIWKKLISLAVKVAPDSNEHSLSKSHFEDLYFSGQEDSWAWQYKVPDVEDVDDP